jgi:cytochrome c553
MTDSIFNMTRLGALLCAFLVFATVQAKPVAAAELQFERDILPIFTARCLQCHGHDGPQAGLDLSSAGSLLRGSRNGPVVIAGASERSVLFQKVSSHAMPPRAAGMPLSPTQIETLRRWIDTLTDANRRHESTAHAVTSEGAAGEPDAKERQFWSFRTPARPAVPEVRSASRVRTPIDAFILEKLEAQGLGLSPEVSKQVLLRRAYFDLVGLPPSLEEIQAFMSDTRPGAYERLIDRLLESPHYGERWGRHWLDAAGYTDESGFANDLKTLVLNEGIWRYRDYVVRSFNQDRPYDRFLTEQLAGDELVDWQSAPKYTPEILDALIATGYSRLMMDLTDAKEVNNPPYYHDVLSRVVDDLASGVLGLTGGCARCHDHKYDPISQKDYYRMVSVFASAYNPEAWTQPKDRFLPDVSKADQEEIARHNAEIDRPLSELNKQLSALRGPHERRLFESKLAAAVPEPLRADVRIAFETPLEQRTAVQKYLFDKLKNVLEIRPSEVDQALTEAERANQSKLQEKIATLQGWRRSYGKIQALWDTGSPPKMHLLRRGNLETPGAPVSPGFFSVLAKPGCADAIRPSGSQGNSSGRRLALARWLTDREHPLTARVFVNRVWMHHFGKGIVATPENFGRMGALPTHPELLDWLAVEFMENGWKLKRLHKLIMTSSVYRQSSRRSGEDVVSQAEKVDSENSLLWRMNLHRVEAEVLRDSVLAVSGRLDRTAGGPPVLLDGGADGLITVSEKGPDPSNRWRRSIYLLARRNYSASFLDVFDFPVMALNCTRRTPSATPLQSLSLMNSEFIMQQAVAFARRVVETAGKTAGLKKQIETAMMLALARAPSSDELQWATAHVQKTENRYLDLKTPAAEAAQKALASVCQVLLGGNEFLYIE